MRPERCFRKPALRAWVNKNAPFKLVSKTVSQSASLMRMIKPSRVTPALLTRMSTLPVCCEDFFRGGGNGGGIGHVHRIGPCLGGPGRISAATFSAFSAVRETQAMSAPSAANFRAMARPIPRPAPVTTAI